MDKAKVIQEWQISAVPVFFLKFFLLTLLQ